MFDDNKIVVDISVTPNSKTHERHIELSFNRVIESVHAVIFNYNPEDVLSKYWTHSEIWPTLKPILFWPGDTMECFNNNSLE